MKDKPVGLVATGAAEWSGVARLFGVRGEHSRCWCQYFALTGPEYSALDPAARKAQLKEKFDGGTPSSGVLAYRDGEPVGWCAVEPRACYPRVLRSQVVQLAEPGRDDVSTGCNSTAEGRRRARQASSRHDGGWPQERGGREILIRK